MTKMTNLAAMLTVAGGLTIAVAPGTARANCNFAGPAISQTGNPTPQASAATFDPRAELAAGTEAYNAGDFRKASNALSRVLPYAPKDASINYLAGAARLNLGDYKGARKLLERAVALNPNMLIAQQDLGVAYAHLHDARATEMLDKLKSEAASVDPQSEPGVVIAAAIDTLTSAMTETSAN
ncbi:MAG: tetratricopeptide repeat protein [Sphingomonas sp.]